MSVILTHLLFFYCKLFMPFLNIFKLFPLFFILLIYSTGCFAENMGSQLNQAVGNLNGLIATIFFFNINPFKNTGEVPLLVAWLGIGAAYLTLKMGFVNLKMMRHSFHIIRGKYQTKNAVGEVTPFQALTTALSATVGLGNIAGVAIAITIGGPGAVLWMMFAGFLGMSSKFTEVTLAQMYREKRSDGHIMGGAMEYLSKGLAEKGFPSLGKVLAIIFAILAVLASFGGGNAYQVSQANGAVGNLIPFFKNMPFLFGLIMAFSVGIVIIGGIKRIAQIAEGLVPSMVFLYLIACLWIIFNHINEVPQAFMTIFTEAFNPTAVAGGIIGAIVQGFKRAVFSSEAGIGSAAIAHSAAAVKYPIRQGLVALYEPFIDTIVICTMTALVIIITGVYDVAAHPELKPIIDAKEGAALTSSAFGSVVSWFPHVLTVCIVLFAYSTMISWSYYGERCWTYLLGEKFSIFYRLLFVMIVAIAPLISADNVLTFSDLSLLGMAFPNFVALYWLSGKVKRALNEYRRKLKAGDFEREMGR